MKQGGRSIRWVMICLVFWATAVNYLDRQTLSVIAPVLIDRFHMSNETYSRIIFAFMLAYTIMNGISGPLIDRLGTRIGYVLTMLWWSAAAALHAVAKGAWSLGICRLLLGMGESGNWPAGVKVVAEWFPAEERALASGIFNSGSAIGAILAPPLVVWIVLNYGWRQAFLLVGASGFVWCLFWMLMYRTPTRTDEELSPRIPAWTLARIRFVWSFTLAKVFIDPVWYFYIFWFPEYLERARHFDMASIGKYAWIPFFAAGLGNFLGGWASALLLQHGVSLSVARKATITLFAFLMISAIPAVLVAEADLSIGLISLAMLGYTGCVANMMALPPDAFSKNVVGSVYGLASMGSGFGGMVCALITGWVVDKYSYFPIFVGAGLMPLACAIVIWALLGPIPPVGGGVNVAEAYAGCN